MSNLKPCPFCGKDPNQATAELGDRPCFYYECENPKCGAAEKGWHDTEKEAINAWNTRPIEDALRKEIAQLQADNRSLVEQMNAMALKPNQAVIEYFYPKYNPENRRIENLPTEECPCIVELYSGEYDIVWWIDGGFEETGWDGYCVDEVKSWACLPKGVKHD